MEAARVPAAQPDDQEGLFDQTIENDVLEAALEKREKAKAARGKANRTFKEADGVAKAHLATLEIEDETTVRCGRFKIEKKVQPPRSVSFETEESSSLKISPLE